MIHTVSLNPALDRSVVIENFRIDAVNRVVSARNDAGGKGINVSKALHVMGADSMVWGFLGGASGASIRGYLEEKALAHHFVELDAATRTNLKIYDPVHQTHTDINEAGPPVSPGKLAELENALFAAVRPGDILVLSGSLGSGVPADIYASWTRRAGREGAKVILDADGEALRLGILAAPVLVKPNIDELERLAGVRLRNETDAGVDIQAVLEHARGVLAAGVELVVVSLGGDGALFVNNTLALRAFGIPIEALGTVGAGDSQVAALARGLARGDSLEQLVAPAIAAGTAAAATAGNAPFDSLQMAGFELRVRYEILQEG